MVENGREDVRGVDVDLRLVMNATTVINLAIGKFKESIQEKWAS